MSTGPVRPVEGRTTTTPEAPDPGELGTDGSGRVTAASLPVIV
jgi:hypothetical protein